MILRKSVAAEMGDRIQHGLNRASINDAARWANAYRVMSAPYPGKWTFDHFPWLRRMHNLTEEMTVGQKAAQMGFTEWALNIAFYYVDIMRMDVLYVLPNSRPVASDFSSTRFDKAVELSEHLRGKFQETSNVGLKRAGTVSVYIRGSNSESQLVSIPVGIIILDEVERMVQENIPLALERSAGQLLRRHVLLSTPSSFGSGINAYYENSTKDQWVFPCPSCSKHIELEFPRNIIIHGDSEFDPAITGSHYICHLCKATLHQEAKPQFLTKGFWQSMQQSIIRGYYISQMYSMNLPASKLAAFYLQSLKDPAYEQQFWNSNLGLPHIVADYQITPEMVDATRLGYDALLFDRAHFVTMGVDQGKKLHVEIDGWQINPASGNDVNTYARARLLNAFELEGANAFEQLDRLMHQYGVRMCVIDCFPEKRLAEAFANRFPGRVKLCQYPNGITARNITEVKEEHLVKVDRTSWLDMALGRFRNGTIETPRNLPKQYVDHITAQIRVPYKDKNGNTMTRYTTPDKRDDHWGHARVYAEVALPLALGVGTSSNIGA